MCWVVDFLIMNINLKNTNWRDFMQRGFVEAFV